MCDDIGSRGLLSSCLSGVSQQHLDELVAELASAWEAQQESGLWERFRALSSVRYVHETPFTVNPLGAASLEVQVPWNPKLALPPDAIVPL